MMFANLNVLSISSDMYDYTPCLDLISLRILTVDTTIQTKQVRAWNITLGC